MLKVSSENRDQRNDAPSCVSMSVHCASVYNPETGRVAVRAAYRNQRQNIPCPFDLWLMIEAMVMMVIVALSSLLSGSSSTVGHYNAVEDGCCTGKNGGSNTACLWDFERSCHYAFIFVVNERMIPVVGEW